MGAISFANLANVFRIPDIRRKLLFTLAMIALYRLGSYITVPGISAKGAQNFLASQGGILSFFNTFSGGGLGRVAIFGLGIMPYITASIIIQLMTVVVPSLEKLSKEGEMGYAKINRITRYITVMLGAVQAVGFFFVIKGQNTGSSTPLLPTNYTLGSVSGISRLLLVVLSITAGTVLLMWIGELITQRGIGNGMSLLIFASILSRIPSGWDSWIDGSTNIKLLLPVICVVVTAGCVFIQEGQRRIPVQYAKRMIGRRMTTGGSTYLPMRVNMAGVIPIIFATALTSFPLLFSQFAPSNKVGQFIQNHLSTSSYWGILLEAVLVIMFTYFYTLVQFNPVDQADNLKKYGGFIPGVRPGAPTANYLGRVLTRLTVPGSLFLASLVVVPGVVINVFHFPTNVRGALGGTTILIVVGVALDLMRQMESQLVMRNYEGFLK